MKKMISIFLAALMLLSIAGMAMAETAEDAGVQGEEAMVIGRISDFDEAGFALESLSGGVPIEVAVTENTRFEADWEIGDGDVALVQYEAGDEAEADAAAEDASAGASQRITATAVRSYSIEGRVSESGDASLTLQTPHAGTLIVNLSEDEEGLAAELANRHIRVFFNGTMALSEPAQVFALSAEAVEAVTGTVTEMGSDYFLIRGDSEIRVNFDGHTKMADAIETGDTVEVYYSGIMTRSIPGQIYAQAVYGER